MSRKRTIRLFDVTILNTKTGKISRIDGLTVMGLHMLIQASPDEIVSFVEKIAPDRSQKSRIFV